VHIGDFKLTSEKPLDSTQPKVAVVMPVFNDHLYLQKALESIINQSYSNFVLIIVNDGSTVKEV
jgi:glycosyltransferase involved in cell wall biosynthesis